MTSDSRLEELTEAVARGWCHPDNAEKVMDTDLAEAIIDEVLPLLVKAEVGPHLGLATTRELLAELTARIETDFVMGGGGLDYTTVDGRR